MEGSSMLEHIMGYFGTYTPAADGAIATFQFEYLTTLGFAAIVIFLGRAIVAHSASFLLLYLSSRVPESSVSPLMQKS